MLTKKVLTVYNACVLIWIAIWSAIEVNYREDLVNKLMLSLLALSILFVVTNMIYMLITKDVTSRGGFLPLGVTIIISILVLAMWNFILPDKFKFSPPFEFAPWFAFGLIFISLGTLLVIAFVATRTSQNRRE